MPATEAVPARTARRWLCTLQAIDGHRPRSSPSAVAALVSRLGYVQIDSINVVDRAHHLILGARLEGYERRHLSNAIERSRRLFEHWTHDACAIPTEWYPHWHHRFRRFAARDRSNAWWRERFGRDPRRVLARVLERVEREGALRARDFLPPDGDRRESGGWWNWHPEKAALEHLWRRGDLSIARRERFEKVYDLPDRVHPGVHALPASSEASHRDWACRGALDRLGIATEREIAHFFAAVPLSEVRSWARAALARGEIERVTILAEGAARGGRRASSTGRPIAALAPAEWRERARASGAFDGAESSAAVIVALAPFDPLVRDRARLERLFGVEFRFEAFTPAPKRRFGYYTMPLLEGDRIVGRIDPRFDREAGDLLVRGPWWEPGVRPDRKRRARLDASLERLSAQVGADRWRPAS